MTRFTEKFKSVILDPKKFPHFRQIKSVPQRMAPSVLTVMSRSWENVVAQKNKNFMAPFL